MTNSLTVVLKVRNEEAMLPGCLRRLDFADEVVAAVDDRTDDRSVEILEAVGVRIALVPFRGFAHLANAGIELATSDWVFLLDADERVSHALAGEIAVAIEGPFEGFRVAMANYFHGQLMQYGGWQERPTRLWRRGAARYEGTLHERPIFIDADARIGQLDAPLAHFSHRSVTDNLTKSANYVEVQARSLYDADAPAVTGWHLFRTLLREIGFRLVLRQGWRDGVAGIYESLYWPFSHMCAQARLWELQQEPPIETAYERLEDTTR